MNRERRTLLLAAAAWPFAATAQQPKKIYRIGYLAMGPGIEPRDEAFRQRLGELGYVDGKNVVIEWRFTQGRPERAPGFAAELVRLKVDCIVATGVPSVRAAKEATNTIPIVIATIDADPVELGFIASLARPGGNVTGFTAIDYELAAKRMELLKELVPKATRALVLHTSTGTGEAQRAHLRGTEAAGNKLGLRLQVMGIAGPDELEGKAFIAARDGRAELLNVIATGWINSHRERFVRFAADLRLPCMYSNHEFLRVGGLMSYSADRVHQNREVAGYVARILSGTKPADLPVQQPTRFELAINMKTAKALGLTIPPTIMVRADRVIE
jgi:putative ABC transport system substrate-binding protein